MASNKADAIKTHHNDTDLVRELRKKVNLPRPNRNNVLVLDSYVFKLIGFSPKGMPKMRHLSFGKFEIKKLIFLSEFITIIIILNLTIYIRSTVLKSGVVNSLF